MIGERLGNYRLLRQIGEGGMGAVYEAEHEQLGKRAAVKLLREDLCRDPEAVKRFLNEGRAVTIIDHPDVVSVFEFAQQPGGRCYIVMEYLDGETLAERLARGDGRLAPAEALRVARQVASALRAAHQKDIVHRDLKPENIMIVPDAEVSDGERAKLMDFGIAKLAEEHQLKATQRPVRTRTGSVMGSPLYIAPEQARGTGPVTAKADVYSLGVILYEALTGRPPFIAEGAGELIGMHIFQDPPPIAELAPDLPDDVARLVHEMLAKDPMSRPAMDQVIVRLEVLTTAGRPGAVVTIAAPRQEQPTSWRSGLLYVAVGGLLLGSATAALVAWSARPVRAPSASVRPQPPAASPPRPPTVEVRPSPSAAAGPPSVAPGAKGAAPRPGGPRRDGQGPRGGRRPSAADDARDFPTPSD